MSLPKHRQNMQPGSPRSHTLLAITLALIGADIRLSLLTLDRLPGVVAFGQVTSAFALVPIYSPGGSVNWLSCVSVG